MAERSHRTSLALRLDESGELVSPSGKPIAEIAAEVDPPITHRRPRPPIIYYVIGSDDVLGRVSVSTDSSPQQIAAKLARYEGFDSIEVPVGEGEEPAVEEVAAGAQAIARLGHKVYLRLPE